MIPSSCTFEADIRLPIGLTKVDAMTKIEFMLFEMEEVEWTIQEAATNPAAASPREHELVGLIQTNARYVRDEEPLPIVSMGGTDCKHFRYNGVPAFSYGPSPATMAEKNERISVDEFLDVLRVHLLTAWDYLGGP